MAGGTRRGRRATAVSAGLLVLVGAVSAVLINELHGGWVWWVMAGIAVAIWAAGTSFMAFLNSGYPTVESLPSEEEFDAVERALSPFFHGEPIGWERTRSVIWRERTAFVCNFLYPDPATHPGLDPSIDYDWEDYPEFIQGAVIVNAEDIRTFSKLKGRRLEKALQSQVIKSWASEQPGNRQRVHQDAAV